MTFFFSCHILGMTGSVMSHDLYRVPNLATSLMNSVLTNMDYMPDYKLRSIIHILFNYRHRKISVGRGKRGWLDGVCAC